MDLAAKSSALLRSKLVMRLGCVLVAVGFLVSSVVTPRARAVAVVDDVAVGAMSCAAFLESIGLPLTATSTSTALVPVGITAVAGEYAAATGAAASGEAVLGSIAAGTVISTAGTIILTAAAVAACAGLAYWLYNTYLVDEDGEIIPVDTSVPIYSVVGDWYPTSDGGRFYVTTRDVLGTLIGPGDSIELANGAIASYSKDGKRISLSAYDDEEGRYYYYHTISDDTISKYSSILFGMGPQISGAYPHVNCYFYFTPFSGDPFISTSFSLTSNPGIPGTRLSSYFYRGLTLGESPESLCVSSESDYSIPEIQPNQQMEITIPSAAPGSTLAELVETVPQQVADGTLSATYTIDTAAPTPPSISDGDVEDVDELGLPSLGEALTRRFPFSIPWDIARGITLLAAPAKTPYFEVDFYAPISDLVGGWQGSTKLVLDFSQFESLGRLSRWTSTIGFCLFLASATNRFIWTA